MKTKPIVEKAEYTVTLASLNQTDLRRIDVSKIKSLEEAISLLKSFQIYVDVNNPQYKDIVHLTEDKA